MTDPRFYKAEGPFTLGKLAEISGADLQEGDDPDRLIRDVAPLSSATAEEVSFLDNRAYVAAFSESKAGACLVSPAFVESAPAGMALLVTKDPYKGFALVARAFYPEARGDGVVSEGAHVDPTAKLGDGVSVAPGAVIAAGAEIGAGTRIGANAVIGEGVRLGADCVIAPLASMRFCIAGDRLHVYAGARIGEDGFGYASDASGHTKIPQTGRVLIGDDVEIGANTTIDRGAGPDTVIGDGCIIDNLVQIGHNVRLGKGCVLVSQVGLSGSATLGNGVVMGGQSGVAGHITVGDGTRIGAQAGVIADVPAGQTYLGSPAQPYKETWRQIAALKRLASKKDT